MKVRRKKKEPTVEPDADAGDRLDAFLTHSGKKRAGSSRGKKFTPFELAVRDAERRAESGDWTKATGKTLVGLYALCHRMIYGVVPAELDDKVTMKIAAKMARGQLHRHFDDDVDAAVEFIKWAWEREKSRENYALANGRTRSRMGFRWQFGDAIVTDFRVDLERSKRRRRVKR